MAESMRTFLLSFGNDDKKLKAPTQWSFREFKNEVRRLLPGLKGKEFILSNADFTEVNEELYHELQSSSSPETWLLVHAKNMDKVTLQRPRYELMKYDVHPNALTQSGNYHFSSVYQAFCEFIDNSIQATNRNKEKNIERTINVHIFIKEKITCIFDNGEGMTSEGLKAFATYFLSQRDRGLEKDPEQVPGYLDGYISKFGVGATQAGFYLGDVIKVITKKDDSPFVTEITISKEKLHERARQNKPVFEDYKCIRSPGDNSTLETAAERRTIGSLIAHEPDHEQFSMVVIGGLRDRHIGQIIESNGTDLTRNLAHVYHYYLHGERGKSNRLEFPASAARSVIDYRPTNLQLANINVIIEESRGARTQIDLKDVDDDLESLYHAKARAWFPFSLHLKVPNVIDTQLVQGVLMYFPHEAGQETMPNPSDIEEDHVGEPMFECFWQGRLAPLSYVDRLEFCTLPPQRARKQKDMLPDISYKRVKGILFFNRYTPISNNKLKILLDERKDLSDALSDASSDRRLPQEFRIWLEKCHRELDKEITFEKPLPGPQQPKNGDVYYQVLNVITTSGEEKYSSGDIVKLDTKPIMYGKVFYFIQKSKPGELDKVIVSKMPTEVYGDVSEEKPLLRIQGKPDQSTLNKIFALEKQSLPNSMKVFKDHSEEALPKKMAWIAGEGMKEETGFWVQVFNGERPPKPVVTLHQKKISVRQEMSGPVQLNISHNDSPIDDRFGFRPFWLGKAGAYKLAYTVFVGDKSTLKTEYDIDVRPGVAEIVRLLSTDLQEVQLGKPAVAFKLQFCDEFDNASHTFGDGTSKIKLSCTSAKLNIKGVKDFYKPNKEGIANVTGIILEPRDGTQLNMNKEYPIRVVAEGIGDVIFPVRLMTGSPERVDYIPLESTVFSNYDEFPELPILIVDKYGQPCTGIEKNTRPVLKCEAFASPRGELFCTLSNGRGTFPSVQLKLPKGAAPSRPKVTIALAIVEISGRKKPVTKEITKKMAEFSLFIRPSEITHEIEVFVNDPTEKQCNGKVTNGVHDTPTILELEAPAGSIVKNLHLRAYKESGKKLTNEEFLEQSPQVTTSWAGEVPQKKLPSLPDCPVANSIATKFVGNVQCYCEGIRSEAKLRILPLAGPPVKWVLQSSVGNKIEIQCDTKKDLSQSLKVVALDKFQNPTEPEGGVIPYVTVEHNQGLEVVFEGELIRKEDEFIFSNNSILSGKVGTVTLSVHDKDSLFSKDSQVIHLKPGPASQIELSSACFESQERSKEHRLRIFSRCLLSSPIFAVFCDKSGNNTPLKATLSLEWIPVTDGTNITKKSNQKGEAMFQANQIRTVVTGGKTKFRVSCPDEKGVKPAIVEVAVQQCNRVKALSVTLESEALFANMTFPQIKVSHETEDGVPVEIKGNLECTLRRPNGKLRPWDTVYKKPTVSNSEVIFSPRTGTTISLSGDYHVEFVYTEKRPELKEILPSAELIVRSTPLKFKVSPGPPDSICLQWSGKPPDLLAASSTTEEAGRTLIPRNGQGSETVELVCLDANDNVADLSTICHVKIAWPSDKDPPEDLILPVLQNHPISFRMSHGKARVPKLTLKAHIGNTIAQLNLVFEVDHLEPYVMRFAFTTDDQIRKIVDAVTPLKNKLKQMETHLEETKAALRTKKMEGRAAMLTIRSMFRGEPSLNEVDKRIVAVKEEISRFENLEDRCRKCKKQPNYPPQHVRQYIQGIVCELAYVSDLNLARILSWYAQSKMNVALTTTSEQQRKVYDEGVPAYSESTLVPFSKRDYDPAKGELLPIELQKPPPNFRSEINFAVNLFDLADKYKHLRASLLWAIFGKTIVVKDLEHAQRYREHLVKQRKSCPAILTLNGDMIASDGLMDPKRKCPSHIDVLKFSFGELPPSEKEECRSLQVTLSKLENLRRVLTETDAVANRLKQAEGQLKTEKESLTPVINDYERQLRKLRPNDSLDQISTPTSTKRRRK